MRRFALITLCLVAVCAHIPLSAVTFIKLGNFAIDGVTSNGGFILDDGHAYKPVSKHQKKSAKSWQLTDVIMLLRKKGAKKYLLVNTRTGEKCKMRNTSIRN
ncbi:MAG: hypothetical protein JSR46_01510 [Verrucomicrobia bacterium]|nr:hypothetical protein [Verrucomicrobiota bacterium]